MSFDDLFGYIYVYITNTLYNSNKLSTQLYVCKLLVDKENQQPARFLWDLPRKHVNSNVFGEVAILTQVYVYSHANALEVFALRKNIS